MSKDEFVDIEREKKEVLDYLKERSDYATMPEILNACKGFDDGASLAKVLNRMISLGVIVRKMGDKIGKNNRNLYEYILPELVLKSVKPVNEILINGIASKKDSAKKYNGPIDIFNAALTKISKKMEVYTIKDFEQKLKVLNKLGHVLDDPIAGLLKEIAKDIEAIKRIHG